MFCCRGKYFSRKCPRKIGIPSFEISDLNSTPSTTTNLVGWGNDFWAGREEYGSFEHRFSQDYKSPAAYLLKGGELMIQSVAYPAGPP